MKENTSRNEEFLKFHFDLKEKGLTLDNIRQAAIDHFKLGDLHKYRARLSALSRPDRYQGKYVALREFMKPYNRKDTQNEPKVEVDVPVQISVSVLNNGEMVGVYGGQEE